MVVRHNGPALLWGVVQRQDSAFWWRLSRFESEPPSCLPRGSGSRTFRPAGMRTCVRATDRPAILGGRGETSHRRLVLVGGSAPSPRDVSLGQRRRILKKYAAIWGISTEHFD